MLRSLWWMVASHLWQTTLVLALLLVFDLWLLGRAPARFSRLLWIAGLVKLFLPLPVLGPLAGGWLPTTRLGVFPFALAIPAAAGAPRVPGGNSLSVGLDGFVLLTAAWSVGVLFLLTRWVGAARRPEGIPVREEPDPRLLRALAGTDIPAACVRVSVGRSMPSVRRLFRPRILLPEALLDQLSPVELRAVLLHEQAHRRRGDIWLRGIERLALVLFYYYPPLWFLRKRLHAAAEMAGDEYAIQHGIPPETYSVALARTLQHCLGPVEFPAIAGRSRSLLARRFRRIAASGRYVIMTRHRIAVALGCLLVAAGSLLPLSPASPVASSSELARLRASDVPVVLKFENVNLSRTIGALAAATGFEFRFAGADLEVRIDLDEPLPLRDALAYLGETFHLRYRVADADTLIVEGPYLAGQGDVTVPRRVKGESNGPIYPERARAARTEGLVIVQAVITAEGRVTQTQVLKVEPPDVGFEEAALGAVREWRYEPATLASVPVSVYFTVEVDFSLQ